MGRSRRGALALEATTREPLAGYVGLQAVRDGHSRDRSAGLSTLRQDPRLELGIVDPATGAIGMNRCPPKKVDTIVGSRRVGLKVGPLGAHKALGPMEEWRLRRPEPPLECR